MPRVLRVKAANDGDLALDFARHEHEIAGCAPEEVGARLGGDDTIECVLVDEQADEEATTAMLRCHVSSEADEKGVPVVLLTSAPGATAAQLLNASLVDGVVDRRWPAALANACIGSLIRMMRTERRARDAQDKFLSAALGQAERMQDLAFRDDLTLLSNRRSFERIILKEHDRCIRFRRTYALVFTDLDHLKEVNALHGHITGGEVLEKVGACIRRVTRRCDHAFRFGGDEFVTLLVDSDKEGARHYAERIRREIAAVDVQVDGVKISASVGIASFPADGETSRQILENADKAVYAAKSRGKDCVVLYTPDLG